ncbi:MAG: response regulator [Desulfuromonadaceae bacterium]|nr:response regulator [Desulfuromonadaceae bacterium]
MADKTILIIEDEEDILALMHYNLTKEGYQVIGALSAEEGLKFLLEGKPDLVLLDLMLPGLSGLDLCRRLKGAEKTASIPIIMVTAKGEEEDVVAGLEMGADDYLSKPFSPRILAARVKAALRRPRRDVPPPADNSALHIHELIIHPGRKEVLAEGQPIDLTFTEFHVLYFLATRPGWVFTRYQIVNAVRGEDYAVTDRAVDVQIVGLRKKMGRYGKYIETVRGVGYRFKD